MFQPKTRFIFFSHYLDSLTEMTVFERLNKSTCYGKLFFLFDLWIKNDILYFKTEYCHARLADGCSKMILSGVDGHICQPTLCITQTNTCTHVHTSLSPLRQPRSLFLWSFTSHCAPAPHRLSTLKSTLRPTRSLWSSHHSPFLFSLHSDQTAAGLSQMFPKLMTGLPQRPVCGTVDSVIANDWLIFLRIYLSALLIWFMKQWTPGKQQHGEQTYVAVQHDSRLQ